MQVWKMSEQQIENKPEESNAVKDIDINTTEKKLETTNKLEPDDSKQTEKKPETAAIEVVESKQTE